MDEKVLKGLESLRKTLNQRYNGFPLNYCQISSEAVHDVFGFERTFGLFIDAKQIGHGHHWNLTPQGEIVDITARQFSKRLPKVYVLNPDSEEAKRHYLEGVCYMI